MVPRLARTIICPIDPCRLREGLDYFYYFTTPPVITMRHSRFTLAHKMEEEISSGEQDRPYGRLSALVQSRMQSFQQL